MWRNPQFYERNRDPALRDLATALNSGMVTLLLGAGVSQYFGLGNWVDVTKATCKEIRRIKGGKELRWKDIDSTWTGEQLLLRLALAKRTLQNERKFKEVVHRALYSALTGELTDQNVSRFLRAVGALTMGSKRGRVRHIFTLNFDCLLEWYLLLHGYVSQIVANLPTTLTDADVIVYHPNGYLPRDHRFGHASKNLLFDQGSFEERILNDGDGWLNTFRFLLSSRVFIAVGLSGEDPILRLLLSNGMSSNVPLAIPRLRGFWFYHSHGKQPPRMSDIYADLRSKGVAMMAVREFSEIEDALFSICKYAAGTLIQ
jgi:hypothetical protein